MTIDINQIIDIGFIVFVSVAAWLSLSGKNDPTERRLSLWRNELETLQNALGAMIAEASEASQNLDRNLRQRKQELVQLIDRIESINASALRARPARPESSYDVPVEDEPAEQHSSVSAFAEDFPNESWLRQGRGAAESAPSTDRPRGQKRLRETIEVSRDVIATDQFAEREAAAPQGERQITLRRRSKIDPTAYRVAQRLLREGKPIHIVARKLELDVADVRTIDSELHGSRSGDYEL
ncbi:MAG: hypothetical protein KDD44_13405, partial [Bdellovibrionales bacterium]|nr:hypothetical protein [Bdellovibrionales bacterium]